MISKTRVGTKYLFWGMVVGILFAPRSGKETRARVMEKANSIFNSILGMV